MSLKLSASNRTKSGDGSWSLPFRARTNESCESFITITFEFETQFFFNPFHFRFLLINRIHDECADPVKTQHNTRRQTNARLHKILIDYPRKEKKNRISHKFDVIYQPKMEKFQSFFLRSSTYDQEPHYETNEPNLKKNCVNTESFVDEFVIISEWQDVFTSN